MFWIERDDEIREPASKVADFNRNARQNFVLQAGAKAPVTGADSPAVQQRRIIGRVENRLPKAQIADLAAEVDRARLGGRVVEIAVGHIVAVAIRPPPRDAGHDSRTRSGTGVRTAARPSRFKILAEVNLDRGLAVPEQVVGGPESRREIFVAVDAFRFVEDRCCR